jgi:hypothetical protein
VVAVDGISGRLAKARGAAATKKSVVVEEFHKAFTSHQDVTHRGLSARRTRGR